MRAAVDSEWFSNWRDDIVAGISTSVVTLPKAIAFGTLVFAPLGQEYIHLGVSAGLVALAFGNLVSFGRCNPILINSTLSLASMMLASALLLILDKLSHLPEASRIGVALTMLFLVMLLSGAIQFVAGLFHMGGLAKYIPRPVLAGLVNGVAVLILLSQVPLLISGDTTIGWQQAEQLLSAFNAGNLLVALVTAAVLFAGPKLTRHIPPVVLAIGSGCFAYYLLNWATGSVTGPLIGTIPAGLPGPDTVLAMLELDLDILAQSLYLAPYILALAGVLSLWSLLFMSTSDSLLGTRSNGNHELIRQGLGNMLIPLLGGVVVAGNSNTIVNYANRGRTGLSRLSCGMFALLVMIFLGPAISAIPMAVLSSILVVFAIQSLDKWSLNLGSMVLKGARMGVPDVLVMLGVTMCMLVFGVLEAVGFGIAISIVLFIRRMGREIIRDEHTGANLRSCVIRDEEERSALDKHGEELRIIEIEGALFFGTSDNVLSHIEMFPGEDVKCIILDMRRITDVDGTGADMLVRLRDQCIRKGQRLLLSGIDTREADNAFLKSMGTLDAFTDQDHFVYLGEALEEAEEYLLNRLVGESRYEDELNFSQLEIVREFNPDEVLVLQKYFQKYSFDSGATVFEKDEPAQSLYLLSRGRVGIQVEVNGSRSRKALALRPGFTFGELALQQGRHRYGAARVEQAATCYSLSHRAMQRMRAEEPELAYAFLAGVATNLSDRVSIAAKSAATNVYL